MNEEVVSSQILRKRFSEFQMGVEPMTFQNTGWNALTTELSCWGTRKIFFRVFDLRALLHSFSLYPSHISLITFLPMLHVYIIIG